MISIVTPSFNQARFLEDAIRSVLAQNYSRFEHIIIDNCSTDGTLEILKKYPHLKWISEPDRGQSDAINKGFMMARGDIIGWLNADEYYLPGAFRTVSVHALPEKVDVLVGDCVFVDAEGKFLRLKAEPPFDRNMFLYYGCYVPTVGMFVNRRVIDEGFFLDIDYKYVMDFEYLMRLARAGKKFIRMERAVGAFRWHANNMSLDLKERRNERLKVQKRFSLIQSDRMLDCIAILYRGKHIMKKMLLGHYRRQGKSRRYRGMETRWFCDSPDGKFSFDEFIEELGYR